jgi:hypothetical protein
VVFGEGLGGEGGKVLSVEWKKGLLWRSEGVKLYDKRHRRKHEGKSVRMRQCRSSVGSSPVPEADRHGVESQVIILSLTHPIKSAQTGLDQTKRSRTY